MFENVHDDQSITQNWYVLKPYCLDMMQGPLYKNTPNCLQNQIPVSDPPVNLGTYKEGRTIIGNAGKLCESVEQWAMVYI